MEDFFPILTNLFDKADALDQNKFMNKILADKTLQAQIVDLNTNVQMYEQGVDSKGVSLGEYSYATIYGTSQYEGKKEKGQRYDHITLQDTGDMYATEEVILDGEGGFILTMDTEKSGKDITKNPKQNFSNIVGLTDESIEEILPEIQENLSEDIVLDLLT